jgi:hypothetical protein
MNEASETHKILEHLQKYLDGGKPITPHIVGNLITLLSTMNRRMEVLEREVLPGDGFIDDADIPGRLR